ncbi:MAG: 3-hydroxybutyrate dehydrogenase [Candidatus Velthaea sp.]
MVIELRGKVSVITGGARGIGRACAEALAEAGSAVAICDVNAAEAETTASAIASAAKVQARGYPCDVRDIAAIHATIDAVAKDFGGIDHLVNNAGVQHVAAIADFPEDKYELVRSIDLDAVFHATKAVWKHLVARGGGRIVNIASVQGILASPYKAAYVAAKHGVVGLTKASALEGADANILVNAICPGAVMTDLVRNQAPQLAASFGGGMSDAEALERAFLEAMPSRRFIQPPEVAALCTFLCSAYAKSITGAPIPIDGGWSAH